MARLLRIGIFQLRAHPAVTLLESDYLQEPVLPRDRDHSITSLTRYFPAIRTSLQEIKTKYLEWDKARLQRLMTWVDGLTEPPQFLVFPECSIPADDLALLRSHAKNKPERVIFGGTHTPRLGRNGTAFYRSVQVKPRTIEEIHKAGPKAVLPIITDSETYLWSKSLPSIFERHETDRPLGAPLALRSIPLGSPSLSTAPLVCAEALQLLSVDKKPELVVIVARERNAGRFETQICQLTQNQIPVVLANAGEFGGSGVFSAVDTRSAGWWFEAPLNGRLPVGDAYVELEINLDVTAVQVGVSQPILPVRLVRVVPIVAAGRPEVELEAEASAAVERGDAAALQQLIVTMRKIPDVNQLIPIRWAFIEGLLVNENLSDHLREIAGLRLVTDGLADLGSLERELAGIAAGGLREIEEQAHQGNVSDTLLGQIVRLRRTMEKDAGPPADKTGTAQWSTPPSLFDRTELIEAVRRFVTGGGESIMVVTGLEGVGKSVITGAAVRQAGVRALRINCEVGTSADSLFELLLRHAGRVPPGTAPRENFTVEDLADALARVEVVVFEASHNLIQDGHWRTIGLERFLAALVEAASKAKTRLLFESRRELHIPVAMGVQIARRKVPGLPTKDAIALLEQQLRRAGLETDVVSDAERNELARRVDGHPGMLILVADACATEGAQRVVSDLKRRSGRYLSAINRLVGALGLSSAAQKVLAALVIG